MHAEVHSENFVIADTTVIFPLVQGRNGYIRSVCMVLSQH